MATATFPSVKEFLKSLQATGATNPRPGAFSPACSAPSSRRMRLNTASGAIPVSYEVIWAVAQKR